MSRLFAFLFTRSADDFLRGAKRLPGQPALKRQILTKLETRVQSENFGGETKPSSRPGQAQGDLTTKGKL